MKGLINAFYPGLPQAQASGAKGPEKMKGPWSMEIDDDRLSKSWKGGGREVLVSESLRS